MKEKKKIGMKYMLHVNNVLAEIADNSLHQDKHGVYG